MIKSYKYPQKAADFEAYVAANPVCHVWRNGTEMIVYTGDDMPASQSASVTPRQIRLALNATGLRSTVEAAVAAGSQDLKDWWEYALEIDRSNPLIVAMAQQLNITADAVDDLFELAITL